LPSAWHNHSRSESAALLFGQVSREGAYETALYGRIFFGASAVLFGVLALMWHDANTWQTCNYLEPAFGTVIAGVS